MQEKCEFIYGLSEEQTLLLMELYRQESWSKDRSLEDVRKILKNCSVCAILDSDTGNMIAFLRVLSDTVYRAFIYDVIVASQYRGLGYGRRLINHVLNHKDYINIERIELYCKDHNVAFYQKLGFEKVPEDNHLMRYSKLRV